MNTDERGDDHLVQKYFDKYLSRQLLLHMFGGRMKPHCAAWREARNISHRRADGSVTYVSNEAHPVNPQSQTPILDIRQRLPTQRASHTHSLVNLQQSPAPGKPVERS